MSAQPTTQKAARYLSGVVAFILVLLPFHAFLTTWAGSNFGHLNAWRLWKELLIIGLALPLTTYLICSRLELRQWLKKSPIAWLALTYLLMNLLVCLWSLHRNWVTHKALAEGLVLNLRFIGFLLICQIAAASDDFLAKYWLKLTLWPGAIVVIFGLLQKFILPANFLSHFGYGPTTVPAFQTVDASSGPRRLQSFLRGPNPLGAYLALLIPAWLADLWKRRFGLAVVATAAVLVLFYSYSRSAILAAGATSVGLTYWLASRKGRRLLGLFLAVAILSVSLFAYVERSSTLVQEDLLHTSSQSTSVKTSNGVRFSSFRSAWHDVVHQPFGRGPGTAGPASTHNPPHQARIAENYYLQLGQEVGVLGLALFLAINGLVAWQLWQRRSMLLAKVLLVTLLGISFINLLSHAWADDTLSLLWWGLAGIALAPILKTRVKNEVSHK